MASSRSDTVVRLPIQVANHLLSTPPISWAVDLTSRIVCRGLDDVISVVGFLTKEDGSKSPYLKDGGAVQHEEVVVLDAAVTGAIPADYEGLFITVGPNPQYVPVAGYHAFEGDGSVSAVRVRGGDRRVSFSFTHLQTEKRAFERSIGRSTVLSFMGMHGYSGLLLLVLDQLRKKMRKGQFSQSTANTNIDEHCGRVYALMEACLPYELGITADGSSLQCSRLIKFSNYAGPFSAHPVAHPENGLWYSVSYTVQNKSHDAEVVILNDKANFVRSIPIHLGRKPMIHDAAITNKYVIIFDLPLLFTPEGMFEQDGELVRSHSDKVGRIGLLPIDAVHERDILWFEIPSCVMFHVLNAYDTPDGVVIHYCQKDEFSLRSAFKFDPTARLVRYEIDIPSKKVTKHIEEMDLFDRFNSRTFVDFPYVAKQVTSKQAKYAFATVFTEGDGAIISNSGVVKYDLETSRVVDAIKYDGKGVGESALVPKKDGHAEDDAYISVFVRDEDGNTAMNIYDATTMDQKPLAKVHAPRNYHVPSGFHSQFISEDVLCSLKVLPSA